MPLRGELDGIGHKIEQHLFEAACVGDEHPIQLRHLEGQPHALGLRQRPQRRQGGGNRRRDRNRSEDDFHVARLDPGEIENVIDQIEEMFAGAGDVGEVIGLLGVKRTEA